MKTKILLSFFALLAVTASAQCPDDNHPHLIDLGLPSGTKWACCNVGANKPDDDGTLYAWGETDVKYGAYDWSTYLYRGDEEPICQDIGNNIAGTEYDVARVVGARFNMPTKAQFEELMQNCTHEFTSLNNHWGVKFTAPNGAFVFLRGAGSITNNEHSLGFGCYWCSDLDSEGNSQYLFFGISDNKETIEFRISERWSGISVRAVEGALSPDDILIDEEHFPDENFRNYFLLEHPVGKDGVLTPKERNQITLLAPINRGISSLQGIEYFPNLEKLHCDKNKLTSLDVSMLTKLELLSCYQNQLTTLDVSQNPALRGLQCFENQLTTLDVKQATALQNLYCYKNQLTSLDLSKNTALENLYCNDNQLASLVFSQNTALKSIFCEDNQLVSLDVSQATALQKLHCYNNQLVSLDVSQATALGTLYCYNNQLTSLNVSHNPALEVLYCDDNQLTTLDVSQATALGTLYCYNNQLTSLDVSHNTELGTLLCYNNQLTTLDVSHNSELQYLYCHDNQLMSLDLSKNTALTKVYCYYNQIRGANMDALVESLPTMEEGQYGYLYVFVEAAYEGNFLMKAQVDAAKGKGWYAAFWPEVNEDNKWYLYEGHSHELECVEPVAPGCETPGTAEYWTCNYKYCGMMFADENGEEEIDAPMEIPATGHIWGEWQVTRDAEPGSPGEQTMTCEIDPSHQQTRPIYAVTVTGGTASVTQAAEGETVTVTADEDGGDFRMWNVVQGDVTIDETATIVTFDMPRNEVELEALFIQQAGLSFEQDEFDADMAETFVAPELDNPNALDVTYASSDESVATVDAATGEVTLVGEGDVVITATFEGDDAFYAGDASYTIHVTDTTGISTWGNDATLDNKPLYNLRGQRARRTDKGVIIRQGKKVLRK